MFATDSSSERATSIEDYQNTCSEFITDISRDYMDWIEKYGTTIKKVDIVMNDGVNKMAENTAGYPFQFDVLVNRMSRFTTHPGGEVRANIKATPRPGRLARIGNYQKNQLLLINSSSPVRFSISKESMKGADILDDYIIIDANNCQSHDLISLTSVVEEVDGEYVTESRGYTTIILLL